MSGLSALAVGCTMGQGGIWKAYNCPKNIFGG